MATLELLPADGTLALSLMAWLLTYAVHSTLLGAGAWCSTFLFNGHALRETLWKAALIGGLLTTTLQMGLGVEPLSGRMVLPAAVEVSAAAVAGEPPVHPIPAHESGATTASIQSIPAGHTATPRGDARLRSTEIQLLKGASGIQSFSLAWGHLLLLAWLSGATFALVRMLLIRRRFLAGLEPRCLVKDAALQESLRQLRRRSGFTRPVRLTRSDHLTSPVALGRDEICLPTRALIELNRPQQEGMLAHELAHLSRRDPLWLVVSGVIESLFFFQPFNRIGRQHLQESTEFLCDDWAVRQTGRSMTLARSLAQVASWLERQPQPAALAPMARLGSPLLRRIQHLVEDRPPRARPGRLRFAVALLPLLAVASLAPAVSASSADRVAAAPVAPVSSSTHPASAPVVTGSSLGSVAAAPVALVTSGSGSHRDAPSVLRLQGTSRSVHEDDDHLSSIEVVGDVTFARDLSGIDSMAPGTTLTIRNRQSDSDQVLRVKADSNGLPLYDYQVNGREEPFEPGGRLFLQESLHGAQQQRAEADARRAQADARRVEMEVRREEMQQQRRQVREFEHQQSRQMDQARQEARRAMSRMESEARQQNRAQAMAYQEALRAREQAMRQQDRQSRDQIQSLRMDARQQAADLYRQAEEAMRQAERADGEDRADALTAARQALHQARELSTRMYEEVARQEKELAQERSANRLREQEELEQMQRQAEESAIQEQEQRQQFLEERERSMELMQREMEQQRRQMMRELEENSRRFQEEQPESGAILRRMPPAPPAALTPPAAPAPRAMPAAVAVPIPEAMPTAPAPPAPVLPVVPAADATRSEAPSADQ